jgi:hypothetical protein
MSETVGSDTKASLVYVVSLILGIPVGIVLTVCVMISFDLHLLWALPIYGVLGAMAMACCLFIGHLTSGDSG